MQILQGQLVLFPPLFQTAQLFPQLLLFLHYPAILKAVVRYFLLLKLVHLPLEIDYLPLQFLHLKQVLLDLWIHLGIVK